MRDIRKMTQISDLIRFNGGGHLNHELFWESLCPEADSHIPESGPLHDALVTGWDSIDNFISVFNTRTAAL